MSACWIAVTGRQKLYANLLSNATSGASAIAVASVAKMRAFFDRRLAARERLADRSGQKGPFGVAIPEERTGGLVSGSDRATARSCFAGGRRPVFCKL